MRKLLLPICILSLLPAVAPNGQSQTYTFTTLAGSAATSGYADGVGTDVRFGGAPLGLTVDNSGNVFVGDATISTIRKITPDGLVTTFAGKAQRFGFYANGPVAEASFSSPRGVAVDGQGTVYVGDALNNCIRNIADGVVSTLAGIPGSVAHRDTSIDTNGAPVAALFTNPFYVAVDRAGDIYASDWYSHTIRKITPSGAVSTLAGNPSYADRFGNRMGGYADGAGKEALFNYPAGIAVDGAGNVYVADTRNTAIRKITPSGVVSTLTKQAGSGGIAVDTAGNVYFATNYTIHKLAPNGEITLVAGRAGQSSFTDGTGSEALFAEPSGLAVDSAGILYVADGARIRKGVPSLTQAAPFITVQPQDQKVDTGANVALTVTATGAAPVSYQWRKNGVNVSGATNAALLLSKVSANDAAAYDVVVSNGNGRSTSRQATLAINPVQLTLAGQGARYGSTDGVGSEARFGSLSYGGPAGVAVDGAGTIYVADTGNNTIRKVTASGVVSTFAGAPGQRGADDGSGPSARFSGPRGLATDGLGNIYVADVGNQIIRKISSGGLVSTIAGVAGQRGASMVRQAQPASVCPKESRWTGRGTFTWRMSVTTRSARSPRTEW